MSRVLFGVLAVAAGLVTVAVLPVVLSPWTIALAWFGMAVAVVGALNIAHVICDDDDNEFWS